MVGRIDIIIGSVLISEVIQSKMAKINGMILQKTSLSCIASGNIERTTSGGNATTATASIDVTDLERF